jgi:hypothetical protein
VTNTGEDECVRGFSKQNRMGNPLGLQDDARWTGGLSAAEMVSISELIKSLVDYPFQFPRGGIDYLPSSWI